MRRIRGRRVGDAAAWGVVVLFGVAAGVVAAGELGAFTSDGGRADPLPGLTVGDDRAGDMPVVTSLRSGGRAERAGLRVGDHIEAVDGRPVRTVAMVRDAMRGDRAAKVALHVVRGDVVWQADIDRADPGQTSFAPDRDRHDPQNSTG